MTAGSRGSRQPRRGIDQCASSKHSVGCLQDLQSVVRQLEKLVAGLQGQQATQGRHAYLRAASQGLGTFAAVHSRADKLAQVATSGLPSELIHYGEGVMAAGKAAQVSAWIVCGPGCGMRLWGHHAYSITQTRDHTKPLWRSCLDIILCIEDIVSSCLEQASAGVPAGCWLPEAQPARMCSLS